MIPHFNDCAPYDLAMEIVVILLLSALIILSGYQIRSLRAVHRRLGKNADRVSKELKGQTQVIKSDLADMYRQIEAIEQLLPRLKLTAPIPPSRGWAASPDFLLTLSQIAKINRPKLTVELGSGVSTLVLAKSGARKIISFDHTIEFGEQTRKMLIAHGVRGVDVRIEELESYPSGYRWYSKKSLKGLAKIDLLVIDGPPSSTNPDARYPAIEHLLSLLSPQATIVLDDVDRPEERKLAESFSRALPGHTLTILAHEKGTAVISPTKK
jgi:predicted O-methyltransferase YrrM